MKKILMLLLIASVFVGGCCSTNGVTLKAINVSAARLHRQPEAGIVVISDERKGQMWFRTEDDERIETLGNIPEASLYNVWGLAISPGDKYLAVLSEGEGHPVIDIFELEKIMAWRDGDKDRTVPALLILDPYPGVISIKGWKSKTVLLVESDVPLTLLDKVERRVPLRMDYPNTETAVYSWDVSTDTIRKE